MLLLGSGGHDHFSLVWLNANRRPRMGGKGYSFAAVIRADIIFVKLRTDARTPAVIENNSCRSRYMVQSVQDGVGEKDVNVSRRCRRIPNAATLARPHRTLTISLHGHLSKMRSRWKKANRGVAIFCPRAAPGGPCWSVALCPVRQPAIRQPRLQKRPFR